MSRQPLRICDRCGKAYSRAELNGQEFAYLMPIFRNQTVDSELHFCFLCQDCLDEFAQWLRSKPDGEQLTFL